MVKRRHPTDIPRSHYAALSRSPIHSLVFVVPLLAFYHLSLIYTHMDTIPRALVDIDSVFYRLSGTATFLPPMTVLVVLLAQHFAHRDRMAVYPSVLGCMVIESAVWTLPLVAMLYVSGMLVSSSEVPDTIFQRIVLGVGGGIYEEFVFRLVMIGLIMLVLVDVLSLRKNIVAIGAVVVTAVAFGLYHDKSWAEQGLVWPKLLFYVAAGAYLGALYLRRGFAVVVGVHSIFNIYKAVAWVNGTG